MLKLKAEACVTFKSKILGELSNNNKGQEYINKLKKHLKDKQEQLRK
jgi:hypothetical protein